MAESGPRPGEQRGRPDEPTGRRGVNGGGVVLALVFSVLAVVGLTGSSWWLATPGPWLVAGLAALAGIVLLVTAGGGRRRPGG